MKFLNLDFDDICFCDFIEKVKINIYNFNGL